MNFPKEVLRLIFHCVYLLAYDEHYDAPEDERDLSWSPYFIFVVCKRWRDVAATLPLYATRVMIYVDEPFALSLTDLEEQIAISKPMRLKVFVVRKDYSPRESPPLLIFNEDEEQQFKELELQHQAAGSQPPTEESCIAECLGETHPALPSPGLRRSPTLFSPLPL